MHRIYQHPSRDRRDGDSQLETDGGQPPPPHCRGLQGPGQPTDASHGTSQEEGQVIFLSPPPTQDYYLFCNKDVRYPKVCVSFISTRNTCLLVGKKGRGKLLR